MPRTAIMTATISAPVQPGGRHLNPQQEEVVRHVREHGLTVVGAGAGSGKTFTMISAMLDLVESQTGTLDQFVLITFTNNAADHLRAEIEAAVDDLADDVNGVARALWRAQRERLASAYIGTIHGYCSQLLRTYGFSQRIARSASTTLSRTLQHQALIDELEIALLADQSEDNPLRDLDIREHEIRQQLQSLAGFCRSRGVDLDALYAATSGEGFEEAVDPWRPHRAAIAELLIRVDRRYSALKRGRGVVDANDLLLQTAALLTGELGEVVAGQIATRHRFIFIDEFQDTNPVQKKIMDALLPFVSKALVVGDTKQSIFGFLAAAPSMLRALAAEQKVGVLDLSLSKRPTSALLRTQNELFASIKERYELEGLLDSWEEQAPRAENYVAPLTYVEGARSGQAERIANEIRRLVSQGVPEDAIAVLARTNRELAELEGALLDALRGDGIDVRRQGGDSLFEAREVIATYHFLRLVVDDQDDVVLYEALQTPYLRHLDATDAVAAQVAGEGTERILHEWFKTTSEAALIERLRQRAIEEPLAQVLTRVYEETGLLRAYEVAGEDQAAANLQRLKEYARSLTRSDQALTVAAFTDHLQQAILQGFEEATPVVADASGTPNPHVRLLTIHAAKGLEFPYVIVPGLSRHLDATYFDPNYVIDERVGSPRLDIAVPTRTGTTTASPAFPERMAATRADRVSEEMRLFYVAITRAEQAVFLFGNAGQRHSATWREEVLRARPRLEGVGAHFLV
jgi:DNA helicase II / ATP-dependent DNA helicase PcrA